MGASVSVAAHRGSVPWYVWCAVGAVTSSMIGVHWDISWHRSIGRDTFWTPAHLAIHLCGVLAGVACAYLILSTTFDRDSPLRASSVRIWGFRGPLGAFIAAWGGIAMLTSAPFDNWWHDAYGLDVKILSPPHMVLALGNLGVIIGTLILILGFVNRAPAAERGRMLALFLYVAGMVIVLGMLVELELTFRSIMHNGSFYRAISIAVPLVLAAGARACRYRWAATAMTGVYTVFVLLMSWILPLFPAEPKLGPVYYPVKQFTPPEFPLLLIIPALALDLLWQHTGGWGAWKQALTSGAVFLAAFVAVQWPFASFLMTPLARNWFFATTYFGYNTNPNSLYARYLFLPAEPAAVFWQEMAAALVISVILMRIGFAAGDRMQRIQR